MLGETGAARSPGPATLGGGPMRRPGPAVSGLSAVTRGAPLRPAPRYNRMRFRRCTPAGRFMPDRPNILFFFPDQWRHDWTGFNRALDLRTPHLARLADRGTRFTDAVCPSPLCAPSRACMALGVEYDRCPVKGNDDDLPLDRTTVYELLRDAGYHTAGCGKFDLHKNTYRWGLDGKADLDAWGFADGIDNEGKIDAFLADREGRRGPYMHFLAQRGLREAHLEDHHRRRDAWATQATPLPDDAYCDNWIGDNGLALLRDAPAGKPWFLQVNFTGPHSPWDVTESMRKSVEGRELPPPLHSASADDPRAIEVRRNYAAMCENIDRIVGLYLDELARRGELDNTLIVFASDHGEMLNDHDLWGKQTWRHASTNVPLIVAGPGVARRAVADAPTELLDVAATFLDFAGVPVPRGCDARKLTPVLRGDANRVRDVATSGLSTGPYDWRTAVDAKWKLVTTPEGAMLFDREADPEELHDLADDPAHRETLDRLGAHVEAMRSDPA